MTRRLALLRIDAGLLVRALGLPDDVLIDGARVTFGDLGIVELRVEHGALPEVKHGERLPVVTALFDKGRGFVRWRA